MLENNHSVGRNVLSGDTREPYCSIVEHGQEWIARQTRLVGQSIAYWRQNTADEHGRKLTAQALAERCARLGLAIGRPAIAKLESGHRQTITVGEVQVIAQALGVAPADLLFPVGHVPEVEVLPGRHVDPWAARQWFYGNSEDPADPNAPPQGNVDSPVILWNEHLRCDGLLPMLERQLAAAQKRAREAAFEVAAPGQESEAQASAEADLAASVAQVEMTKAALRRVRATMRALGMTPPALLPESARSLGEEQQGHLEPWREEGRRQWLAENEGGTPE